MEKSDIFLWAMMGLMLVVFMPLGLIILAYLVIKTLSQMMQMTTNEVSENEITINPIVEKKYKVTDLSEEEAEKAR
jgi:uncharacterized membrane protein